MLTPFSETSRYSIDTGDRDENIHGSHFFLFFLSDSYIHWVILSCTLFLSLLFILVSLGFTTVES